MSAQAAAPAHANPGPLAAVSKAKKKNKKKKGSSARTDARDESAATNGAAAAVNEDDGDEVEEAASPTGEDQPTRGACEPPEDELALPGYRNDPQRPSSNGTDQIEESEQNNGLPARSDSADLTQERLDALARERDELKAEVTQLRQSLESITGKHDEDLSNLKEELEQTKGEKDHAETQYQNLLGKVNTIRSQLGERLKADAEELSQARSQIEELEEQNRQLRDAQEESDSSLARLQAENARQAQEIEDLRGRTTLSQANWVKERDELIMREAQARDKFEEARQAMQDWEVLAMEERSQRENLSDRITELEEQIITHKDSYERAASERDSQSQTVDGLQRALRDIQDARKKELRELVENSQSQLEELRKQLQAAEEASDAAKSELEKTRKELERAAPFEEQVREKNLLIGKLRHEGVILNDHLTKALRFLKQRKPEDNVDRQLVTNHFLRFLELDRSDPKKFQILQIIAALLAWTDEQKEQAGLSRPGSVSSTGSLRLPQSPFKRTPSTPQLSSDPMAFEPTSAASKESLAELWSDFLEREAQEGTGRPSSRKSNNATPPASSAGRSGSTSGAPPTGLGLH